MRGGPEQRARLLAGAGTCAVVVLAWLSSTVAIGSEGRADGSSEATGVELLVWLVGTLAAVALVWRRRFPVQVCVAASLVALVLPLDSVAALVALTWVLARGTARHAWGCGVLVAGATGAALWRDARRPPGAAAFSSTDSVTGDPSMLPVAGYVVVGVLVLGVAIAVGLARRWRDTARRAAGLHREQVRVTDELRTELSRQDERDAIAREMHDTVAHQLSLVSLHASALEVTADDPATDVREAARSMRSTAHRALEEMRALITTLRDAEAQIGPDTSGVGTTLADLPALVSSARAAGAEISANVFVRDADAASPALTRAVYRIVQESLTNAIKHAPGSRVDVDVQAAPGAGVDLTVRNALAVEQDRVPLLPGGGSGLLGMRERAETLGGTFDAGPRGDRFVVQTHLPWSAAPSDR